jgi:hypothetical protein
MYLNFGLSLSAEPLPWLHNRLPVSVPGSENFGEKFLALELVLFGRQSEYYKMKAKYK